MGNQRSVVQDINRDGVPRNANRIVKYDGYETNPASTRRDELHQVYKNVAQRVPEVSRSFKDLEALRCVSSPLTNSSSDRVLCAFWSGGGVLRCVISTVFNTATVSYVVSPRGGVVSLLSTVRLQIDGVVVLSACRYRHDSVLLITRLRLLVRAFDGSIESGIRSATSFSELSSGLVTSVCVCDEVVVIWCLDSLYVVDHGVMRELTHDDEVPILTSEQDSIMLWRYDAVSSVAVLVIHVMNVSTLAHVVIDIKSRVHLVTPANELPQVTGSCAMCGDILVDASESFESVSFHDLSSWRLRLPKVSVKNPSHVITVCITAQLTGSGPQLATWGVSSRDGSATVCVFLPERGSFSFLRPAFEIATPSTVEYVTIQAVHTATYYESMMQMQSQCKRIDGILEAQFDMEQSYHDLITFQCEADESEARQPEVFGRYMEWLRQSVVSVYNMAMGLRLDVLSAIETVASKVHSLWQSSAVDMNTAEALAQELRECFQQVLVSVVGLIALYRDCDEAFVHKCIFELRANYIRKRILLSDAETNSAPVLHLLKLREALRISKNIMMKAHADIMGTPTADLTIRGLPVLRDVFCEQSVEGMNFALEMPNSLRDVRPGSEQFQQPLFVVRQIARLLLCFHLENIGYSVSSQSIKVDADGNVFIQQRSFFASLLHDVPYRDRSTDIWFFGCVIFYMFSGGELLSGDLSEQKSQKAACPRFAIDRLFRLRSSDQVPELAIDLLKGCLQPNPSDRITSEQAFNMLKHVSRARSA